MSMKTVPAILVVDDEPDNFDVIQGLLAQQDYDLYYAASGAAAIAALDKCQPDLILLDVMMPDIDGIEVCHRIQALPQWQAVPIIMVTALNEKEDMARCLQAGATEFISKPVNSLELRARIQAMLRIKHQYDSLEALSQLQNTTIQMLESSLEALRGNLASSLSHELNTPLNGLLGGLGLLSEHREDMDAEEMDELLTLSRQSALRLERLIQRFLVYLRLELASAPDANLASPEAAMNITQTATEIAQQGDRGDDLHLAVDPAPLAIAPLDLQRLVMELVENACKFSRPGTPVQVKGEVKGDTYELSVCDRGRGMTPEQIAKVGALMQFERADYEQQGAGLGLKIAQKIAEIYGGSLAIQSTYKESTQVRVTLTLARTN